RGPRAALYGAAFDHGESSADLRSRYVDRREGSDERNGFRWPRDSQAQAETTRQARRYGMDRDLAVLGARWLDRFPHAIRQVRDPRGRSSGRAIDSPVDLALVDRVVARVGGGNEHRSVS